MNATNEQDADSVDWAAVERAYADPEMSVMEIASSLGMSAQALTARAAREGGCAAEKQKAKTASA